MLRVMQTMRTGRHGQEGDIDAGGWKQEEEEEEGGVDDLGPWGGAAVWEAPVQEVRPGYLLLLFSEVIFAVMIPCDLGLRHVYFPVLDTFSEVNR